MADVDQYDQLTRALADVDEARFEELVAEILDHSPSPETIDSTFQAVQAGMEEVGKRFQEGE
jgi:methanogenic corrinoid protein MtbC1